MTTTAVRPAQSITTPESQDLALLEARLLDPNLEPYRAEIERAIVELRAKAVLGA